MIDVPDKFPLHAIDKLNQEMKKKQHFKPTKVTTNLW